MPQVQQGSGEELGARTKVLDKKATTGGGRRGGGNRYGGGSTPL